MKKSKIRTIINKEGLGRHFYAQVNPNYKISKIHHLEDHDEIYEIYGTYDAFSYNHWMFS